MVKTIVDIRELEQVIINRGEDPDGLPSALITYWAKNYMISVEPIVPLTCHNPISKRFIDEFFSIELCNDLFPYKETTLLMGISNGYLTILTGVESDVDRSW